jgi:hypothetical protein
MKIRLKLILSSLTSITVINNSASIRIRKLKCQGIRDSAPDPFLFVLCPVSLFNDNKVKSLCFVFFAEKYTQSPCDWKN